MKRQWVLAIAVVASMTGSAAMAPPVLAQQKPAQQTSAPTPLKLAIVDVARVTQSTAMTRDIARQIDTRRKQLKAEIQSGEEELRNADQELQRQRVLLSPAAFEDERKKFEGRVREMQTKVQESNQVLGRLRQLGERDFEAQLAKAMVQIANEGGYNLILRKRNVVMLNAESFDITGRVIQLIDKAVPSYKIPEPKPAAAPGK